MLEHFKASDRRIEPRTWLWKGWIRATNISLLVGEEGLGKSTFSAKIAAALTRGALPGNWQGRPRTVLYSSAEDTWNEDVQPRLEAHGADMERIIGLREPLLLPKDIPDLCKVVAEHEVSLVIIDPIMAHLEAKINSYKDQSIRQVTNPLREMAEEFKCAVLLLGHFNKRQTRDLLDKTGGSKGWTAAVRSAFYMTRDPKDPDGPSRLIVHRKTNNEEQVAKRTTFESKTVTTAYGTNERVGVLGALDDAKDISWNDVLADGDDQPAKRDQAKVWLLRFLNGTEQESKVVIRAGEAAGFGEATVRRAARVLKVRYRKDGHQGPSLWSLPNMAPDKQV